MSSLEGSIAGAWRSAGRLGPWLSLVIVVGVGILAPQPPSIDAELVARHDRIRRVLEGVPLRCGEWIGEEQPLAPAAVELLRPNASLSRSYRRIGGDERVMLSLIHCSDARDMAGHYPPICYPSHGWSLDLPLDASMRAGGLRDSAVDPERFESLEVKTVDGRLMPLRVYRFSRMGEGLTEIKMTVLSAFILPDGSWNSDLGAIRDVQTRRRASREGVAQIQVAVAGWPSVEFIAEPVTSLLSALPRAAIDVLGDRTDPGTEAGHE